MFTLPIYQIDAFTNTTFRGNPAAVCPLSQWLPDETLQAIAAENNLSETAFFVKDGREYKLRWFTPTREVPLCGHATLASAYVLYHYLNFQGDEIIFNSISGKLRVLRDGKRFVLDFPGREVKAIPPPKSLVAAMDTRIEEVAISGDTLIVLLKGEAEVLNFKPDFSKLSTLDHCVNITAKGKDCDFVSRFFAPTWGIPEDPVTGSAHCGLAIYWSRRLQKTGELHALQVSERRGELFCKVEGDRVFIAGEAAPYMSGTITIPAF